MVNVNVNLTVPAIEKLVDCTASGVGSVAGAMLAPLKARLEAAAKRIAAHGEADSLRIIASAQSDARSILVSPDYIVQGELDIGQKVNQRIQFQEEKRQRNIESVVRQAATELGDRDVPDSDIDHDWTARFFGDVQDVSSEEMQSLWAKVLAGEIERPGSMSTQTLSILRNLDLATAIAFRRLCSLCVSVRLNSEFIDVRVPSMDSDVATNALQSHGINYDKLNLLNEHGLIISDYNSRFDYNVSLELWSSKPKQGLLVAPFGFQGKCWVLSPTAERAVNEEFRLSGVALTRSGRELSQIVELEPMDEYAEALAKFFASKNLQMTEVDSLLPREV